MPITINGSGTITGLSAGGLPDGTVQPADLSTGAPTWDTSGNVGIGTSSPANNLHVNSANASTYIRVTNTTGDRTFVGSENGLSTIYSQNSTGAAIPMAFFTGSSERARIDSSGNLLVGTTSSAGVGHTFYPQGFYRTARSGTASQTHIFFNNGNGDVGSISTSASTTTYSTSSDYRLKENVQPMTGALARVAALKPCTYTWKVDGSSGEGFIAHELQAVVPDCVTGYKDAVDADGNPVYQGIDTSFLVATLTAAIQELKAIVDAQAVEIAALKGAA